MSDYPVQDNVWEYIIDMLQQLATMAKDSGLELLSSEIHALLATQRGDGQPNTTQ